jgi:soluble cytochrome b562
MSLAIKQDAQIKELLGHLDQVRTARTFNRWKRNFLDRWESFLDNESTMSADKAYRDFSNLMDSFVKMVDDVNAFIDKQELTLDKATVKARNSLNEMTKVMVLVNNEKDALIPQTNTQEKKRGYNKFHMGAVLIRDNFNEYGRLVECKDALQHMRTTSLNEVADKQQLEEMDNFSVKLAKFCEIMADLGIFGT